jgi:sugar O-acyltransferase (sialic acid O-acetyltransferase NeuD family)
MKPVIGLGAGGHAKVVIEILRLMGEFEIVGLLDRRVELHGSTMLGIPVTGDDTQLQAYYEKNVRHAFIGVGGVGNTQPRRLLYEEARGNGFEVVSAVHPGAWVSEFAKIGHGATVMAGAIINTGARLGDNVVVNTGAIIEHDCEIGDHVHIASGACLAGTVLVNAGAHIGLGARVKQNITIGSNAIVGAGAVIVKDVPEGVTVIGVPARVMEQKRTRC